MVGEDLTLDMVVLVLDNTCRVAVELLVVLYEVLVEVAHTDTDRAANILVDARHLDGLQLFKSTENYHCGSLSFFFRLFSQKAVAKVKILCDFELSVTIKKCLSRKVAFPVCVVPVFVPLRVTCISIYAQVLWYVRYD